MPNELEDTIVTDVLVIGSGASGLTAALTAASHGLRVQVVEKEAMFGGTTAWSGGMIWIPLNGHQAAASVSDSKAAARSYIQMGAGNCFDSDRVDAFLENAPQMLDFLERTTEVKFDLPPGNPDYRQDYEGSVKTGRALVPTPYDGRTLGPLYRHLRPPPRERTLLLGMQVSGADVPHLVNAKRSATSAMYVASRVLANLRDVVLYGRSMRFLNGGALAARLAKSIQDRKIPLWLSCPAIELLSEGGRVVGATVRRENRDVRIKALSGVILATGGFSHDTGRRSKVFPQSRGLLSAVPASNSGDGIRLAETVGAVFDARLPTPAAWFPMSQVQHRDGTAGAYAHLLERGKPGYIAVTPDGRRFTDEARNYHDFAQALLQAVKPGQDAYGYFVCDHRAFKRYGLGMAKPFPYRQSHYLKTGYLKKGATIRELALKCGFAPEAFEGVIASYNAGARVGRDLEFGKGENLYDRGQGDSAHGPNPCVAPIETAPFYAVKFAPGDLATFSGLKTDRFARVVDDRGESIPGLYAVGNDQESVFGGAYPGAGATLGPGMTFGYVAGRHVAGA